MRGDGVMRGYWRDPDRTAEVLQPDGWLHTGDIGVLDALGNVAIVDRKKEMIVVGGFNVYPAEVENLLLRHGAIAHAAVIGVPDDRLGEVPWAFVVPGASREPRLRRAGRVGARRDGELQGAPPVRRGRRAAAQRERQGRQAAAPCARRYTIVIPPLTLSVCPVM